MSKIVIAVLGGVFTDAENILVSRQFPANEKITVVLAQTNEAEMVAEMCEEEKIDYVLLEKDSPIPIWTQRIKAGCLKLVNGTLLKVVSFEDPVQYEKFDWFKEKEQVHG